MTASPRTPKIKKGENTMRKTIRLCAVLLSLFLLSATLCGLASCGEQGVPAVPAADESTAAPGAAATTAAPAPGTAPAGDGTSGETTGETPAVTVNMTESYAAARTDFHTISGIWLPQLADVEMLPSSSFSEQFLTACFDITGTEERWRAFTVALRETLGEPTVVSEENKYCNWELEYTVNGKTYTGWLSNALNTEYDPAQIYVNFSASVLEDSYVAARALLASATGVKLPALAGLEVSFGIGRTSFMFDIVGGEECDKFTYEDLEEFFDGALTGWTKDAPEKSVRNYKSGYTDITYNHSENGAFLLIWDSENEAIYINAMFQNDAFSPYGSIKTHIRDLSGVDLPDYQGLIVNNYSQNPAGTEITLNMTFPDLTYNDFLQLESAFTDQLGNCLENYPSGDETGRDAQWRNGGLWYSLTWSPAGLDYNDRPVPPSIDLNISPIAA